MLAAHVSVAARPAPRRPWLVLPVLAAAAAALVVALPDGPEVTPESTEVAGHYVGVKGPPLAVFHEDEVDFPLIDGTPVTEGDRIQVSYNLPFDTLTHGGVFSVDGNGTVTRHHAGPMIAEGRHFLPHSYQLDDAPRFERFYLIADDGPIDAARYERALRRGEDITAPEGGLIHTITLIKE